MFDRAPNGTAYELTGPEHKPVVTLIHGLGLCRHLWAGHLPAYEENFRVLNYDLFGHGDSAPPPERATLSVYADQLAGLVDHLGLDKTAVVGFSIGGMINRRFAMDYPDRLSALVILNSPHDRGEEAQRLVEERAAKVREEGPMATLDPALTRWFTPQYRKSGEGVALVREWRQRVDLQGYPDSAWVLAHGVRELINPGTPIEVPTLVLTCENDSGSTPKMTHDIAAEIPGSEAIIIPELQHLGLMERPRLFYEPVLEFLERRYL